ncbi:MAG: gamma-glutamyl-gamma-aminobutyrate hydrolase family protein [Polyangiaceae bacterium]|nr:gamma-glutamyl-gamma-aminobutyrate hydrolase family protein [Polyangiaceae bacterium]
MHADPARPVFNGKALYYLERSMARWVGSSRSEELRALVYMVPSPGELTGVGAADVAADLDGLVLAGGVDVSPRSYGEEPRRPEWTGDGVRDEYELALVRAMVDEEKPVLGICRGHQLLNVAFGGSLHQDIRDEVADAFVHRDATVYDQNAHAIALEPGSWLAELYPGVGRATVNSVHHQAVKRLGDGVTVSARSTEDGVVEAISIESRAWVRGVQWHPEFTDPTDARLLDNAPILRDFLDAARVRLHRANP